MLDFENDPAIFSHVKYLSSELIDHFFKLGPSQPTSHEMPNKCFEKILLVDLFTIAGTGKPYPVVKLYEGNG